MDASEIRPRLVEQIWKSIAQSGVSIADIPPEKMEALVDAIASGVLVTLDETLDDIETPAKKSLESVAAEDGEEGEQVLWEGRPFMSLTTYYQITSERVRIVTGILGKDREDIELVRIQDIDRSQGVTERMLGIGDIEIRSHDPSSEVAVLRNVRDPDAVNEILRRAMLEARKNSRYTIQEEM